MIEQTKQQRHWALRYPSGDALAETAALLVLRKKAEAIWGESGDD
jgi:hypothetical protein